MLQSNQRIAIVVAVIGVIGSLGAAFIANWDKFFVPPPQPRAKIDSQPPADSIPNLGGLWRDSSNPNNSSQISQDGNKTIETVPRARARRKKGSPAYSS